MSDSNSNTNSIISNVIREYADCLTYNYEIFKEALFDYKNHIIKTEHLIQIMVTMFLKISKKYKQIEFAIEIAKLKELKMDVYIHLANFIKYIDQKSIEIGVYKIGTKEVENLLTSLIEKLDLYLNKLNQMVINEKKIQASNAHKKSCGLFLMMPMHPIKDDLMRKCSPLIKHNEFVYYGLSSDRDELDSVKSGFNFNVDSRPSSICLDEVPSFSPTEGLSPAISDTEDESPLSPSIDQLIPDWQDFLNECLSKWYVMGGETPSNGCLEYMHLFLGGRRLSCLHSPSSPVEEISKRVENGPVVFRRSATRRSRSSISADEKNILAETDVNKYLVFKTGDENSVVQYAELDVLIVHATENLDTDFCDTFLSTYRSFVTSDELFEKLVFRFNMFSKKNDFKKKSFTLITKISRASSRHSITEELLTSIVNFVHQLIIMNEIEWAIEIREIFELKLKEYQKMQELVDAFPEYLGDECDGTLLDFKPILIAQQMTLMAYELFCKIELPELLVSEVKADTPNVTAFIHHCDKLSYWITTMIGKLRSSREVQKYIKYLVNVMKYLKEYRDYSSCWAILVGLQTTYIYKVTKKYEHNFSEFTELFSFSANYKNYRSLLKESKLPRIPLICIALHDLIYISEATKRFKPVELENSINFYRIWRQYKYIKIFKEEKFGYPFKKNAKVLTFFRNFDNHISVNKLS